MFYKVIYNDKIIDVLDRLVYLKYQEKYNRMIFCGEREAQAIMSSNEKHIWHEETLYDIPVDGYDTVRVEEIDVYEYEKLKSMNCQTKEEIVDELVLFMLQNNIL